LDDIQNAMHRDEARGQLAAAQARAGDFKAARNTLDAFGSAAGKRWALLGVAEVRFKGGDRRAAADLYREAIDTLRPLDQLWLEEGRVSDTAAKLSQVVKSWTEAGDDVGALAWAEKEDSAFVRAIALASIAQGIVSRSPPTAKR
jgi:hypothetical protein